MLTTEQINTSMREFIERTIQFLIYRKMLNVTPVE